MRSTRIAFVCVIAFVAAVSIGILVVNARASRTQPSLTGTPQTKQLWHCGMHPQVIQDHPGDCPICHMALTPIGAARSGRREGAGVEVQIDPRVVQNMGVRTAEVTQGPLKTTVRAVGLITLPEPGLTDVSLKVGGWIEKLYVNQEGMRVEAGDPLFDLYSPELQVSIQELLAASNVIHAPPTGASEQQRKDGQSLLDSAKQKLQLWNIANQDIDAILASGEPPRGIVIRSPATGFVEEKMVIQGAAVQAGMKLFRIADHSKMWLEVQVFAASIPLMRPGQEVSATVEGIPGTAFHGEISFIYPRLDPATRTLKVRATLENPKFELKPGMYATAELMTNPVVDATLCPREAVIDTGTKQIAFVADREGHFVARRLRIGQSGDQDKVQILEGLAPGERVVTSGQFLMDVESRTIEAMQKLAGTEPLDPGLPSSRPTSNAAADQPKEEKAAEAFVQVFCPMAKASWLQAGEEVRNPYMGKKMLDCGEVTKTIGAVDSKSPLFPVLNAYLRVSRALEADQLDAEAMKALASAIKMLPSDEIHALDDSAVRLSKATDIRLARTIFKEVSEKLIASLKPQPR